MSRTSSMASLMKLEMILSSDNERKDVYMYVIEPHSIDKRSQVDYRREYYFHAEFDQLPPSEKVLNALAKETGGYSLFEIWIVGGEIYNEYSDVDVRFYCFKKMVREQPTWWLAAIERVFSTETNPNREDYSPNGTSIYRRWEDNNGKIHRTGGKPAIEDFTTKTCVYAIHGIVKPRGPQPLPPSTSSHATFTDDGKPDVLRYFYYAWPEGKRRIKNRLRFFFGKAIKYD